MRIHKSFLIFLGLLFLVSISGCSRSPAEQMRELDHWDLVWISDSTGWGVENVLAEYIEEDTGIPVEIQFRWMRGLSAGEVLQGLEGESYEFLLNQLPEIVGEAEVIVMFTNPDQSQSQTHPHDFNCGQDEGTCYVTACSAETFEVYVDHLEQIYAAIFELRQGQPTIIWAYDSYNPYLANRCAEDGVFEACRACWEELSLAGQEAAAAYGVPFAHVFDAFNGPEHDQDPQERELFKDGIHPNQAGAQLLAQTLREMGYEPIVP